MDAQYAALSTDTKRLLRKAGFTSIREILKLSTIALGKELGVDVAAAQRIHDEVKGTKSFNVEVTNAFDLVQSLSSTNRHLLTLCKELDGILGGGFPVGAVTELCGAPGAGKTQMSMQLCATVAIPSAVGGLDGETLYLDTEGSFSAKRIYDMAEAVVHNLRTLETRPSVEDILQRIHVFRAYDAGEQLAFIQNLATLLKSRPKVRLVVIDSVAHHFRHSIGDSAQKNRTLSRMAQLLNNAANDFKIIVVATNHMTTRDSSNLVPALGEHWFHGVTNRIVLTKLENKYLEWRNPMKKQEPPLRYPARRAEIVKSSSMKKSSAEFVVSSIGIRSGHQPRRLSEPTTTTNSFQTPSSLEQTDPKRRKTSES